MANYFQFKSKHPEYRLLYYICGAEFSLVQEVRDAVISQWKHQAISDSVILDCGINSWSDIDSVLHMQPVGRRIIVLDNFQEIKDVHKIGMVISIAWNIGIGVLPSIILVVVSNEEKPETLLELYRPFVEKGRFVECKTMSVENLKRYCVEDYNCTEDATDLLLEKVSYNFVALNNELEKLSCLGVQITRDLVDKLVIFSADNLLLHYLLNNQPAQAVKVAHVVPVQDIGKVLSILVKKMSFLLLVMKNDKIRITAHALAARLECQPWQLLEYFEMKKWWNEDKIVSKLKLITELESVYASNQSNILPLLVRWW